MSSHLTDEELSQLALERANSATLDHLEHCRSCRLRADDLQAVRHVLGALLPPHVPPDVFAGITARISHEPPASPPRRLAVVITDWTRGLQPRHLGIVAAVALIGGVASVALRGSHGAGTAPTNIALETSRTAASPSPTTSGAANTHAQRDAVDIAASDTTLVVALGRDYHHATLSEGADDLLSAVARPTATAPKTAATSVPGVMPTGPCLRALGAQLGSVPAASLTLVAVEAAQYDTRPATVLVLMDPANEGRGVALALAGRCTGNEPQVLDEVTLTP